MVHFLIFVPFFIALSIFIKLTKKSTKNLPPGPWKLPVIGNLHNLYGAMPHRALQRLALRHGPLMHVQFGELSTIVASSPDTAREIMKIHDQKFAYRPKILLSEIIMYGSKNISFSPPGEYWRQLRNICASELLSMKRVQSFRPLRESVYSDMIRLIASNEGWTINLTEKIFSSTNYFTTRATFGSKTMERKRFLEMIAEGSMLAAGFDIAELFPSIKLLQNISGTRKRLTEFHREVDEMLEGIIDDHKVDNSEKNGGSVVKEDLVDVLLKYQDPGFKHPLTSENIKCVIMDVLGAGSETSSTTTDWAMAELLKNPNVMEKVQDEVRLVFDDKGFVDESYIPELKYLKSIIKETLRLHTPAPLLLPRKCNEACKINGYEIPVNTKIIVNAWAISRDPKSWEDPESFKPERFLDSPIGYKGNYFEYIPFGSGKRICPGITYGIANVEVPLAMLLYHFDWKLPDGVKPEEMEMEEGFGVTAKRKKNLFVVPIVKRPLPAK